MNKIITHNNNNNNNDNNNNNNNNNFNNNNIFACNFFKNKTNKIAALNPSKVSL